MGDWSVRTPLAWFLWVLVQSSPSSAITTESPNITETESQESQEYPRVVIGFSVFAGAILIGIVVAKVVDMVHDRQTLRDDASDISDFSRNLLRARFTVLAFKAAKKDQDEDTVSKMARLWVGKAAVQTAREEDGDPEKGQVDCLSFVKKNPDDVVERYPLDGLGVPTDSQLASTPVECSPNGTAPLAQFRFPTIPTISAIVGDNADSQPGGNTTPGDTPKITYVVPKTDESPAGVHQATKSNSQTNIGSGSPTGGKKTPSRPVSTKKSIPGSRPISARPSRPVMAGGRTARPKSGKITKRV